MQSYISLKYQSKLGLECHLYQLMSHYLRNMNTNNPSDPTGIRYQPNERPSAPLTLTLGLQIVVLSIAASTLVPTVVMRAADTTEVYVLWAVFTAVIVGGGATILQAVRIGRTGMGYILVMGPLQGGCKCF